MHLNHFGAPVRVHFTTLGLTFEAFCGHFCTLEVIFGALWVYFCVSKNRLGRQRPSKAPPRPPPRKSTHPFGHLLGPLFVIFLHVLIKKVGSEICYVFSLILGTPWALHGMGSHAIRTRLCSRNTLFRFCMCSKK